MSNKLVTQYRIFYSLFIMIEFKAISIRRNIKLIDNIPKNELIVDNGQHYSMTSKPIVDL